MGPVLGNCIMSGVNCRLGKSKGVWLKSPSDGGICPGVRAITVAGVLNSLSEVCWKLRLEAAPLVGGGVCIWEVSMLWGRGRVEGCSRSKGTAGPFRFGSGEDESLREGSTGGRGRLPVARWLTWNSGSSGVHRVWLRAVGGRSAGVERTKDGVWAGVCCPLTRGVDQASRKCDWENTSVLGVFSGASGKVADLGVEDGLGRCHSVDPCIC
jgi:hypothetical protein